MLSMGPRKLCSVALTGALLAQTACGAGWHRIDPPASSRLAPRQQVQVFQGLRKLQLHAIELDPEWISGIPFHQPVECDSCRIRVPRSTVDSLKAGNPTAGFFKTLGLVLGGGLLIGLLYGGYGSD
jgi:hypothetical protein